MSVRFQPERARQLGRVLFQKYDIYKSSFLQPKQCFQLFSDFCYRILNIPTPPNMQQANSMHDVLDLNKDKRVSIQDFQNLAVKYLCGQGFSSNSFQMSSISQVNQSNTSNNNITIQKTITTVTTKTSSSSLSKDKKLTPLAQKRLDVVRRLFQRYDKDRSGYLTEEQVPFILQQTYKQMGQVYKPTREDVKSYMKMVDKNSDGKVTLDQFEFIVLESLRKAGFQVYQNQIY